MKITTKSRFHVAVALRQTDAEHLFPGVEGTAKTDDMIVIVWPKPLGDLGGVIVPDDAVARDVSAAYIDRCADMAATLRQLPHVYSAVACWEEEHTCSYCNLIWEVTTQEDKDRHPDDDTPVGMPVCCDKAVDEWIDSRCCTFTADEGATCEMLRVNGGELCAVHQERADGLEALAESVLDESKQEG